MTADDVHVWCADLACDARVLASLDAVLSGAERARAQRFRALRDHDRFVVAHGLLRYLVGAYLACDPSQVELTQGAYGKPRIQPRAGEPPFHFSLAHSGPLAAFAFSCGTELGVDIEQVVARGDVAGIADRFFTAAESAAVRQLPADQVLRAFYRIWTRKEAYLKATGRGLSQPLHSVDVTYAHSAWLFYDLPLNVGSVGALAVRRGRWRITTWRLQPSDVTAPKWDPLSRRDPVSIETAGAAQ